MAGEFDALGGELKTAYPRARRKLRRQARKRGIYPAGEFAQETLAKMGWKPKADDGADAMARRSLRRS